MRTAPPLVLVVEDDHDTAEFYRALLGAEGLAVEVCRSGQQALAWWESRGRSPDILITDVLLPDGDGLELISRLRDREVGSCPPVLVLSAHGDPRMPARCREAGAAAFLDKLRDLDQVVPAVRAIMALPASR